MRRSLHKVSFRKPKEEESESEEEKEESEDEKGGGKDVRTKESESEEDEKESGRSGGEESDGDEDESESESESEIEDEHDEHFENEYYKRWSLQETGKVQCVGMTVKERQCKKKGFSLAKKIFFLCGVHLPQLASYEKTEKARHKCSAEKCPKYVAKDGLHCEKCECSMCVCLCTLCAPKLPEHPQNRDNHHCHSCTCRYCVCEKHRAKQMKEMPRGISSCICKPACNYAKWRGTASKNARVMRFAFFQKTEQKMRKEGITGAPPPQLITVVDKTLNFLPQELPLLIISYLDFFPYEKVCATARKEKGWSGSIF